MTMTRMAQAALVQLVLLVLLSVLAAGQGADEECLREPYRPQYHFSPRRQWINDPNGLVFYEGEWHLFYQYNPTNPLPGNVSWGHAVSGDLVHWRELGVAIRFTAEEQVFSGSAVIDYNDTAGFGREAMVAVYTADTDAGQTQDLAYSNDRGRTFTRFSGNPVLDIGEQEWRDPKVQWYAPTRVWLMVLALSDAHQVQFYSSPNLRNWTFLSAFGPAGATGGQWECPDLFELPVEGQDAADGGGRSSRWVLIVSINPGGLQGGSGTQYFLGDFNGTHFTSDEPADAPVRWLDYGKDYYAAVSWNDAPDHGRYMIGWMSNWRYASSTPTSPWRNAMSVPRRMSLRRLGSAGAGAVPAGGVVLAQSPVAALESLRRGRAACERGRSVNNGTVSGSRLAGKAYALEVDVKTRGAQRFGVHVRVGRGQRTVVGYDVGDQRLYLDRTMSGRVNFSDEFPGTFSAPLQLRDNRLRLQILVDWGSVEVFAYDGEVTITDIIFPDGGAQGVELFAEGGAAEFSSVRLWRFGSYRRRCEGGVFSGGGLLGGSGLFGPVMPRDCQ